MVNNIFSCLLNSRHLRLFKLQTPKLFFYHGHHRLHTNTLFPFVIKTLSRLLAKNVKKRRQRLTYRQMVMICLQGEKGGNVIYRIYNVCGVAEFLALKEKYCFFFNLVSSMWYFHKLTRGSLESLFVLVCYPGIFKKICQYELMTSLTFATT